MSLGERVVPEWLDVSRETLTALGEFEDLVRKWTKTVNLVSKASVNDIWSRHILDSAQISLLAGGADRTWVDLGSGGGFPALVLSILAKGNGQSTAFVLVESDARKATFLAQAARILDLPVKVLVQRVDAAPPLGADVLTARALAPLDVLLGYARTHLGPNGRAFFPKGASHADEVASARTNWSFRCTAHPSRTDPQSAILEVDGIEIH
jgi:16S rRNA (guanine527-N7)-methyltransferase